MTTTLMTEGKKEAKMTLKTRKSHGAKTETKLLK